MPFHHLEDAPAFLTGTLRIVDQSLDVTAQDRQWRSDLNFFSQSRRRSANSLAKSTSLICNFELPDSNCASTSKSSTSRPRRFECRSITSRMHLRSSPELCGSSIKVSM